MLSLQEIVYILAYFINRSWKALLTGGGSGEDFDTAKRRIHVCSFSALSGHLFSQRMNETKGFM